MTSLNTIIEEEKKEFDMKFTNCLQGATTLKFIGTSEYQVWAGEEIKSFLTTAMQRAHEAGLTEAYRVKEIVEDCGHQQKDGSMWMKRKEVIKRIDAHLDQLKKEIKG